MGFWAFGAKIPFLETDKVEKMKIKNKKIY